MEIKTVADAVAVLDYLHRRQLLCDKCGCQVAIYTNAFHSRCEGCKVANSVYNRAQVPNELEARIVSALVSWTKGHPSGEGGKDPGDPASCDGDR